MPKDRLAAPLRTAALSQDDFGDALAHLLHPAGQRLRRGARRDDGEFLTAIAADDVAVAETAAHFGASCRTQPRRRSAASMRTRRRARTPRQGNCVIIVMRPRPTPPAMAVLGHGNQGANGSQKPYDVTSGAGRAVASASNAPRWRSAARCPALLPVPPVRPPPPYRAGRRTPDAAIRRSPVPTCARHRR